MSASTGGGTVVGRGRRVPWGEVLLSATGSVSWAVAAMAGAAALGLRLLEADASGAGASDAGAWRALRGR